VAEVVGGAAQQGGAGLAAHGPRAGGDGPADISSKQASNDGEASRAVEGVEHGCKGVIGCAKVGPQPLVFGPARQHRSGGHAAHAGQGHGAATWPHTVQQHAQCHHQGGAEQGGGRPGSDGGVVASGPGNAGPAGREGQQVVGPPAIGQVPGIPEQPQGPELDGDAQPGPQQVVAGAADHSAAFAASVPSGCPPAAPAPPT